MCVLRQCHLARLHLKRLYLVRKLQRELYAAVASVAVDGYRSDAHTFGTYLFSGAHEVTSRIFFP